MSDWAPSDSSVLDDIEAFVEQIKKSPSIRTCDGMHPIVKHYSGRLGCLACREIVTLPPEMLCDCLKFGSLVFEKDGMYHAKPGPCADATSRGA